MKKIAILQSNYIPWKGYFDIINMVDEFVLFDDVQYTKNDWRNRNIIKTVHGLKWLTIPVKVNNRFSQSIRDTKINKNYWVKKHWKTINQNYSKAHYFKDYKDDFENLYLNCDEMYLSQVNLKFILLINKILGIKTIIRKSHEFALLEGQTKKLVGICKDCNASIYVSGPAARNYLNEQLFVNEGISIEWMSYGGYTQYTQLFPPFEHCVSIIDLIFNEGPNATKFMKSFNND